MFWVSHRCCPQLPVNGSLNQHMAEQVSLFQTPVKTWLTTLANQREPHRDMAVQGATCSPEGHPTPDQLCSYMSMQQIAPDAIAFWPIIWELIGQPARKKEKMTSFWVMNSLMNAVSKCLSNVKPSCGVCILESKVGWMWIQLRLGFSVACLMKDMGFLLWEGGCREYRQGNLCNLFTRPWEAHKDEWDQGQLLFSHSSPNLYW